MNQEKCNLCHIGVHMIPFFESIYYCPRCRSLSYLNDIDKVDELEEIEFPSTVILKRNKRVGIALKEINENIVLVDWGNFRSHHFAKEELKFTTINPKKIK